MLSSLFLFCIACSKDKEAPFIRLDGWRDTTIVLNDQNFTAPPSQGEIAYDAYAKDAFDGDLAVVISFNNFNRDSVGTYSVVYTATDESNNSASITRTIKVISTSTAYSGSYKAYKAVHGSADTIQYFDNVEYSRTRNDQVYVNNLDDDNIRASLTINADSSVEIAWQKIPITVDTIIDRAVYSFQKGLASKGGAKIEFYYSIYEKDTAGREHYYNFFGKYLKQ